MAKVEQRLSSECDSNLVACCVIRYLLLLIPPSSSPSGLPPPLILGGVWSPGGTFELLHVRKKRVQAPADLRMKGRNMQSTKGEREEGEIVEGVDLLTSSLTQCVRMITDPLTLWFARKNGKKTTSGSFR